MTPLKAIGLYVNPPGQRSNADLEQKVREHHNMGENLRNGIRDSVFSLARLMENSADEHPDAEQGLRQDGG